MDMPGKKLALFPLAGGLGMGVCAVSVLLTARESVVSAFSLKLVSASIGSGMVLGGMAALYVRCSQRERLKGIGAAIFLSLIPLLFGVLCIGALTERPSSAQRSEILLVTAGILVWWLLVLLGGIVRSRGVRWGGALQSLLVATPISVALVGVLYFAAAQSLAPDSFWSHWAGTRLVGIVIVAPVCCLGLLLSLLDSGFVFGVAGFAVGLMVCAALGERIMGSFGWPVAGAFGGAIVFVVTLACVVAKSARARKGEQDAAPNSRPPSQLPTSSEVRSPDSRTPSSGGCG